VQDQKLLACAEEVEAPFFFYDLDALEVHLKGFAPFLDEGIKLWYACKANPLSAVLKKFSEFGFGIDIASLGELEQALAQEIPGKNIISTGPGKSKKYLRELLEKDVSTIVLESTNQALWLNEVAAEMGRTVDVLLRGQLDWDSEKSVLGGSEITPFGVTMDEWSQLNFKELPHINIRGFHVFQWGNLLDLDRLEAIWTQISEQVQIYAQKMNVENYVLDLGGGIGIPYQSDQKPVRKEDALEVLKRVKQKAQASEIWLELGRYAIGEYGVYCSQVVDQKVVKGKSMLILEGGINHLLRPGLTQESFPVRVLGNQDDKNHTFSIHGPLCTALDFHGDYLLPETTKVGDWLMFSKVGAYGFTESMPFFLCHQLPAEIIWHSGKKEILRPVRSASSWLV
jgi:diaminopimelate decarboxylase